MLLLRVIDDRGQVVQHIAETFPCTIGRAADADLRVEAPGVWDRHATITLAENGKFVVRPEAGALILVDGTAIHESQLSMGQELSLGSARLLASLAPARQRGLAPAELAVWAMLMIVLIAECVLIYFVS